MRGFIVDALRLAHVIKRTVQEGLLIDIGCGNGLIGRSVIKACPDLRYLGIEIDADKCRVAQNSISGIDQKKVHRVVCADIFAFRIPPAQAICCNPPLIPGEKGFIQKIGSVDYLFWQGLIKALDQCEHKGLLFLHLFDFVGITDRMGDWPCLAEIAQKYGYSYKSVLKTVRQVSNKSNIMNSLSCLATHFPKGGLIVNGSQVNILACSEKIYELQAATVSVEQTFVILERRNL